MPVPFQQTKSYRDHLHRLFAQQYPDVSISQQRIADQRRAIVKNNLLSKAALDAIKEEVAQSLHMKSFVGVKQEVPTGHIVASHMPIKAASHLHQQHLHLHHPQQQQHHHPAAAPLEIQAPSGLQNQPHIIIRVNSTNSSGSAMKHHFVEGSGI